MGKVVRSAGRPSSTSSKFICSQWIGTTELLKVGMKADDFAKASEDEGKILNIFFKWCNKKRCIIGIKRGSKNRATTSNFVKQPMRSGEVKDAKVAKL
jgi:hypothetical protein